MARKEVDRAIAAAWTRSGPELLSRARSLRRALDATPDPAAVERAKDDAHRLAGLLGTLGSPRGSELARALERHFESNRPAGREIARRIAAELTETLERATGDRAPAAPQGATGPPSPPPAGRRAVIHALVIDDDVAVRELVRDLLERAGWLVSEAPNGREGLRALFQGRPDVIVLDVEMPDLDGWQTLERIRDVSDVPVLMLTAHGEELEKVRGLRGGADDYVTKPFGAQELLARVELLARGKRGGAQPAASRDAQPYGDSRLVVDPAQRIVLIDGEEVALTPVQYRLIATFAAHPGQILSREQLLDLVWGGPLGSSGDQVKVQVGRLRRRLAEAGLPDPIETVRGFGYRYRP